MERYVNVGIDLAMKGQHQAVVVDEQGVEVGERLKFSSTTEDLDRLMAQAEKGGEVKARYICEPTGSVWKVIGQYLAQRGREFYLVKQQKVHDLRKFYRRHTKTDQTDALTLGRMPLVAPEALNRPSFDARHWSLKKWVKRGTKLSQQIAESKRGILDKAEEAIPGITACIGDPSGRIGEAFYTRYLNPFAVKRLGLKRFHKALQKAAPLAAAKTIDQVFTLCLRAVELYASGKAVVDLAELQEEVVEDLEILALLEKQLQKTHEKAQAFYREIDPNRDLESIYGVGEVLAPVFMAALAGKEFRDAKAFRAYTGMIPRVSESGVSVSKGGKLTKAGPDWLKAGLYLAAEVARQWDPQLAQVYWREMVEKGHHHTQAVFAVATHLADRIFVVYRKQRRYELRDLQDHAITSQEAKKLIQEQLTVPPEVRARLSHRKTGKGQLNNVRADRSRPVRAILP